MENKKTLGAYIRQRRQELGLTQKEFAERLFVTESAVSKWERGLSYPDITLVREICAVLEVSEHELLTASEDTEARTIQGLARKYLRLVETYRRVQYILYGAILLGCAIGNLASRGRLDWFWIAAAAVMMAASLTLLPALVERHKYAAAIGGFTVSLLLLLLFCALWSAGGWFLQAAPLVLLGLSVFLLPLVLRDLPLPPPFSRMKASLYLCINLGLVLLSLLAWLGQIGLNNFLVASASVLLAFGVLFLPVVLRQLPLSGGWERRKTSLYLVSCTALLLLLLAVCAVVYGGDWFPAAAASALLIFGILCLPVVLRQLPLSGGWEHRKASLYLSSCTALLLLLLAVCAAVYGGNWLPAAAAGVLLAFSILCLPVVLRQLPLSGGWERRKATLYLSSCTALLLLLLAVCAAVYGGSWFPEAAAGVLLGLGAFFLPVFLCQLPLPSPLCRHKAALYGGVESILLILLLAVCAFPGGDWFWMPGLPLALYGLGLPWACLLLIRYVPINRWFKAGGCFAVLAFYQFSFVWVTERLCLLGGYVTEDLHPFGPRPDFSNWTDIRPRSENVMALLTAFFLLLALICCAVGIVRRRRGPAATPPEAAETAEDPQD